MNKRTLLGILGAGGLALAISCDGGSSATSAGLDANDCPYGTFRPMGLADCVFPATDVNNQLFGVSDNRCASGQPAIPPQCISDAGERAYLSTSSNCATGYRFLPGACNRNDINMGAAGSFPTGGGTGVGFPSTGGAGTIGTAGFATEGEAGSFGTGTAGSNVGGMAGGIGGLGGGIGGTSGASGTGGSASSTGVDASGGSAGSSF